MLFSNVVEEYIDHIFKKYGQYADKDKLNNFYKNCIEDNFTSIEVENVTEENVVELVSQASKEDFYLAKKYVEIFNRIFSYAMYKGYRKNKFRTLQIKGSAQNKIVIYAK